MQVVSFFAGCSGLDLGFEQAGFQWYGLMSSILIVVTPISVITPTLSLC